MLSRGRMARKLWENPTSLIADRSTEILTYSKKLGRKVRKRPDAGERSHCEPGHLNDRKCEGSDIPELLLV